MEHSNAIGSAAMLVALPFLGLPSDRNIPENVP
jgi:hypothetical protein